MIIRNQTRDTLIADTGSLARSPLKRMIGLLGRGSLNSGEALAITPCRSIHMLFMKLPLDVIFIDRANTVVGLCPNIRPFQFSSFFPHESTQAHDHQCFQANGFSKQRYSRGHVFETHDRTAWP